MKVYLDSNIIIDVLQEREPFFKDSFRIIQLGLDSEFETIISAGEITNIYYVIRKSLKDPTIAREKIFLLSNYIKICKATTEDITNAIVLFMPDFEDAVVAVIAKREKADYIITRNEADFENSPVPAVSPSQFFKKNFTKVIN